MLAMSGCLQESEKNYLDMIEDIKVHYNAQAFDYFNYDEEKQAMEYNFNIFYNYEELLNYFETPEIYNICHLQNKSDIKTYFEKYYIMHFVSCLGTSDTVQVYIIDGNETIFNIDIITYTNKGGYTTEGLTIDSYFFLVDKKEIENKTINHQIFYETRVVEE